MKPTNECDNSAKKDRNTTLFGAVTGAAAAVPN